MMNAPSPGAKMTPTHYTTPTPHGAMTLPPPPMTMSEEDADLMRSKSRAAVGKWVADDAAINGCVTLTNNAYTHTYVGSDRGFDVEGHMSVKCCCFNIGNYTSKGSFAESGVGGTINGTNGESFTYTLVSIDKVNRAATYAVTGKDKYGLPVTGTAVQSQNERVETLQMMGAPPGGLKMTFRK